MNSGFIRFSLQAQAKQFKTAMKSGPQTGMQLKLGLELWSSVGKPFVNYVLFDDPTILCTSQSRTTHQLDHLLTSSSSWLLFLKGSTRGLLGSGWFHTSIFLMHIILFFTSWRSQFFLQLSQQAAEQELLYSRVYVFWSSYGWQRLQTNRQSLIDPMDVKWCSCLGCFLLYVVWFGASWTVTSAPALDWVPFELVLQMWRTSKSTPRPCSSAGPLT